MAGNNFSQMNFEITDEQRDVLKTVDAACRKIEPIETKCWQEHKVTPRKAIVEAFAPLDLLGMPVSERYGGMGLDKLTYALALGRIAQVSGALRTFFSGHTSIGGLVIDEWGTHQQKENYLPSVCTGERIMAFGLTEPEAGSDPKAMSSTYEDKGNHYLLNGVKTLISNGTIADLVTVFARKLEGGKPTETISGFIVETASPGFKATRLPLKGSLPSSDTGQFTMTDVRVPKENLLFKEGKGMSIAYATLMNGRLSVAAGCIGEHKACLEETLKYARQRVMHGKEIGKHQLVQGMIAEIETGYESSRNLVYKAAVAKQSYDAYREKHGQDKNRRARVDRIIATAKLHASRKALDAALAAVYLHGGNGIFLECPAWRHFCDLVVPNIYEGTNNILKLKIAAGVLGSGFEAYK